MQNGWNIEEWRLEDGWIPVLEEPSSVFLSFHFAKWMSSCLWSYDLSLSTFLFTLFSSSERCSGKDRLQLHWDMINLPRIQSFINFFIESAGYVSAHDLVSEMLRKRSTISEREQDPISKSRKGNPMTAWAVYQGCSFLLSSHRSCVQQSWNGRYDLLCNVHHQRSGSPREESYPRKKRSTDLWIHRVYLFYH